MASVMGALGDRWGVLIMRDLYLGLTRYDDLHRSSSASHATLSDRLKVLQKSGLIERQQYQDRPDRYEYVLTERGRDAGLVMLAMMQIGDEWNLDGLEGPPLRFIDGTTGHDVKLALIDAETNRLVNAADLRVEAGPGADELTLWRLTRRTSRDMSADARATNGKGDA